MLPKQGERRLDSYRSRATSKDAACKPPGQDG